MPHKNGFYYHFVNTRSGERVWKCEISTIDTAILLCGVLACRGYFAGDTEIHRLASDIYARVDWPWLTDGLLIRHGWKPESGFLRYHWGAYSELMMLYLLAIGAPEKPIAAEAWKAWRRPLFEYEGLRYVESGAPLFVHQYSHAWFNFRGVHDDYANYFANSITATKAHRRFCEKLGDRFPHFGADAWGNGFRFGARLHRVGRPAGAGQTGRHAGAVCRRRFAAVFAAGVRALPSQSAREISARVAALRLRGRFQSRHRLV